MPIKLHINDYPKFDKAKHVYVVATGCGDGWLAYCSISEAIAKDTEAAIDNAYEDSCVDWYDWVNSLSVYDGDLEVARFNLEAWKWETLSRGTKEEL